MALEIGNTVTLEGRAHTVVAISGGGDGTIYGLEDANGNKRHVAGSRLGALADAPASTDASPAPASGPLLDIGDTVDLGGTAFTVTSISEGGNGVVYGVENAEGAHKHVRADSVRTALDETPVPEPVGTVITAPEFTTPIDAAAQTDPEPVPRARKSKG